MRRKQFLAPEFRRSLLFNTGFIVVYGVALYQLIDNYAHLGGFLAGAVYALVQVPGDPHVDPRPVGAAGELAGLVSLRNFYRRLDLQYIDVDGRGWVKIA